LHCGRRPRRRVRHTAGAVDAGAPPAVGVLPRTIERGSAT
jgi:hypothetical protein